MIPEMTKAAHGIGVRVGKSWIVSATVFSIDFSFGPVSGNRPVVVPSHTSLFDFASYTWITSRPS
jgi:hypothetical protein